MNNNKHTQNTQSPAKQSVQPNWYARMHQSTEQINTIESHPARTQKHKQAIKNNLNLSIFFRIWFTVALIMVIAGFVVFNQLFEHVEPTSKQVIEDTLVDTGKLLSANLATPLQTGQLYQKQYQAQLDKAFYGNHASPSFSSHQSQRYVDEQTLKKLSSWFNLKTHSSFRMYITDSQGIVIYDSLPKHSSKDYRIQDTQQYNAEGEDYSQWNDVYLTLRGEYGARSSRVVKDNESTSVMYVAQPITDNNGKLIGVVSVGKPVSGILPYLDVARQRMLNASIIVMAISLLFAGLVAWWLQQSIALVTRYTRSLATDTNKPSFYLGKELNELIDTIEDMKHKLENKAYVTDYVHTLTHELKSPLTAIKASGELLSEADLDDEDRQTLSQTINEQSQKLQSLIDRLLLLAKLEQPTFRLDTKPLNIMVVIQSLLSNHQPRIQQRQLSIRYWIDGEASNLQQLIDTANRISINADMFWLSQALDNLLTNAIHFASHQIDIHLQIHSQPPLSSKMLPQQLTLQIINDGELIPEYALDKVFERYFSLSHQVSYHSSSNQPKQPTPTNKGSGLGLTLAKQVIEHHGGSITLNNAHALNQQSQRVVVTITLPTVSMISLTSRIETSTANEFDESDKFDKSRVESL